MKPTRVEAFCVLSADGKVRPARVAPAAVRSWLRGIRDGCDSIVRPRSSAQAALADSVRRARGRRVLVEGGPRVMHALAAAGLLTHLHAAILPVVSGGASFPTLLGPAASSLLRHSVDLRLQRFRLADGAALVTYAVLRPAKTASARTRSKLQDRA